MTLKDTVRIVGSLMELLPGPHPRWPGFIEAMVLTDEQKAGKELFNIAQERGQVNWE